MYYIRLNGKNLKRFKNLQSAKAFAIRYLYEYKLNEENDDFEIICPHDVNFEDINIFRLKHIF